MSDERGKVFEDMRDEWNRLFGGHDWRFAGTAPYQEMGTDRIYFGDTVGGTPLSYRLYPNGGPMFNPIHKCEYCGSKFASDFVLHVCPQCGAPY